MARLIIDDENWNQFCDPMDGRCATISRDYAKVPYGSIPGIPPRTVKTIPMEEWPDRIADKARDKSTLKHIWVDSPIGVWNQGQVGYCHAFSAAMLVALKRAQQGLPFVSLSASSVGGPVTGWRNAGAYIHDDLDQIVEFGVSSTDFVPMLTTNQRDAKPGWKENALLHRVSEFTDVKPRNFLEHGSLLLENHPVGVGLNYWRHAVTDLVLLDLYPKKKAIDWTRYGIDFLNSWDKSWGDGGFGIRTGNKALADAIYALYQIVI